MLMVMHSTFMVGGRRGLAALSTGAVVDGGPAALSATAVVDATTRPPETKIFVVV